MVNLDVLRKDMAELLETDKLITAVEIRADSIDEALADASVQFDTKVSNLEYEILERGFDGFMGIAKKPWLLKVYQNPDTIVAAAKKK
ncbi:MAG: Jag N-terminal domain-containing protein, partial [Treponema sp.]|nr:Jag N-terminal domain-containing protein [Treponema sp.]